jgi:hypothetical protein
VINPPPTLPWVYGPPAASAWLAGTTARCRIVDGDDAALLDPPGRPGGSIFDRVRHVTNVWLVVALYDHCGLFAAPLKEKGSLWSRWVS